MRERRQHLILVGLIALALLGAAALAVPGSPIHKEPVLGLDLQGGLEVVLQAVPERGETLQATDLERSKEIIRNRIDKIGVAEPEIRTQGDDQIAVELPGVENADQARDLIGQTAQLELYDLQTSLVGPSVSGLDFQAVPAAKLNDLLAAAATQSLVRENGGAAYYLFETEPKRLVAGPLPTREALLDTESAGGKVPKGHKVFALPNKTAVITCGNRGDFCPGVGAVSGGAVYFYLFKHDLQADPPVPQMRGEDLELSGTQSDFDTQTGQPIVLMQFTDAGADKFHDITRDEAQRGRRLFNQSGGGDPDLYNQNFAIVLDRELITAPSIDFTQYPDGISGGQGAQITGIGSIGEAQAIALVLQTGALPVKFKTLSERNISATLGEDSLRKALRAALAGMVLVAVFLLVAYRFLGLVAVIGLAIYAAFLYAMILIFNVTLTLPGFAGMILTIGVAADANIVIFERIKEEARSGKSVRAAVGTGYAKGFSTIVDANVVTAITAVVLFVLATAGVKGFALMLLIGTAMSLITAVFATRAMLGLLAGFRWFARPGFMGATGAVIPKWIQHDYVGKRRIWFAFSAAIIAISLGSLGVKQLNLGIDFEGGTELSFQTPQPTALDEVRDQAATIGQEGAIIQGVGDEFPGQRYGEFSIKTEALDGPESQRLRGELEDAFEITNFGATTVSASFGEQIARSAIYAIIFSLFLVVLYITFRFQWKFALATITAMIHDLVIAIGIYSVAGLEVTSATVAALLTVLGYSIYDTIIILDRVRENLPLMRRATMQTIGNVSLWETIRRSLATTFITLLPISALYVFGGETLKDFAFALLVGIGSGAYSSIFIAAPMVAWLKEREPEFAKRRETATGKDTEPPASGDGKAPVDVVPPPVEPKASPSASKRERRRQRRSSRPHGRAR
ncbi:MAG: protein translocase subunit SecD [Gaiellaceae bacterium]